MRICFINPPRPWLVNPHAQAPIGILYLAAVLEQAGHDVRIGRPHLPADAYCITGTWLDVPQVNELAEAIRAERPDARIIVGGPIALSPDELSEEVDLVVRGEAEAEICTLVESLFIGFHPCTPPEDLDALPFPARHLWAGPFGGNVFIGGENYFGGGSTIILSSRGCPYDCAFCASSALAPRKVRSRSAASVVEEMEQCVVDYGVRQFRFSDENFNASPKHVHAICAHIMARADHFRGLAWRASIAAHPVSAEMFMAMGAAGCREVSIGVESVDLAVLKQLCPGKLHDADESMAALRLAHDAGLKTRALFMCGTPGENAATAQLNIDFMRNAPCDALAVTVFTPMPGSDIFDHPERYGCKHRGGDPRSVCLYGPEGKYAVDPTIELDDFPIDALRQSMVAQIDAAEATGKLGKG